MTNGRVLGCIWVSNAVCWEESLLLVVVIVLIGQCKWARKNLLKISARAKHVLILTGDLSLLRKMLSRDSCLRCNG